MKQYNYVNFVVFTTYLFFIQSQFIYALLPNRNAIVMSTPYIHNQLDTLDYQYNYRLLEQQNKLYFLIQSAPSTLQQQYSSCMLHIEQLESDLLVIIKILHEFLTYWQDQATHPLKYWLAKGPHKWLFEHNQKESIAHHINQLHMHIEAKTTYLGYLRELLKHSVSVSNQEELKMYVYSLAIGINWCLIEQPITQPSNAAINNISNQAMDDYINKNNVLLRGYIQKIHEQLKPHAQPHHVRYHWLEYSAGILTALGIYSYIYTHQEKITEWIEKLQASAKYLYLEKGYKPLQDFFNIMHNKNQTDLQKLNAAVKDMHAKEDVLRDLYTKYYIKQYPTMNPENITKIVNTCVQFRITPPEINEQEKQEIQRPISNIVSPFGWIARLFLMEGLKKDLILQDILIELYPLRLLATALPTIALSSSLLYSGYKIVRYTTQKTYNFAMRDRLQEIKKTLLDIERIFNAHNNTTITSMNYSTEGQLHYLLCHLLTMVTHIPNTQRSLFLDDITELNTPTMSINQKCSTLNRMYRTYLFLQ